MPKSNNPGLPLLFLPSPPPSSSPPGVGDQAQTKASESTAYSPRGPDPAIADRIAKMSASELPAIAVDTKPAGSAQGMLPALARQATPSHAFGHRPQSAARSSIPMQPLKRNRCMPSVRLSSHQPTDFAIDNRPTCC